MATFLDEAAFAPKAPASGGTPGATFLGEEAFGKDKAAEGLAEIQNPWSNALLSIKDAAKYLGKSVAAATDMVVGVPGQAIGVGADLGARAVSVLGGESRQQAEASGAAAKEHVVGQVERFLRMAPGGLREPVQTIVKGLGGGEPVDQKIVGEAIEKVASGIEKITRGYVTKADATSLFDTAMLVGGARGGDVMAKAALEAKRSTGATNRGTYVEEPPAPKKEGPDLSSIPEPVEVTPAVLKDIFKKAKSPEQAVENLFERAKRGEWKLAPVEEVKPGEIGAEVGTVEKGRLSEGVVLGDNLQSAAKKAVAGERGTMTAEERIALSTLEKERQLVDAEGKPFSKETGFGDAKMLALIAGATGVGLLGAKYISDNHPEIASAIAKRVFRALGLNDTTKHDIEQNDKEWKKHNEEFVPLQNDEGNGLALTDGLPLAVGAVAGRQIGGRNVGSWHPEAVARLSSPLKDTLVRGQDAAYHDHNFPGTKLPQDEWADKAVSRYLNRYAGTEGDPLKDVEVPFGAGTKKWGDLWDSIVTSRRAGEHAANPDSPLYKQLRFVDPAEPVWELTKSAWERSEVPEGARDIAAYGKQAIMSQLAHIGDYLRQNVDPAKLSQYDLVRAVKETAAHDAKMEKLAERASADSTAQLPVYKDYGDGMKWVELKLPEKLTPEQARGVREMTPTELRKYFEDSDGEGLAYLAIDRQGKPIRNSYTDEIAQGATPKEAFLAGRLAEEGNALGHCVGGYCDAVASGESKIYSLRDAKGKSHVTVEVEPGPQERIVRQYLQQEGRSVEDNIIQIKGKANRAPVEAYRPYVQDFVRSGKWGEVGDLGNAGLVDHQQSKTNSVPFRDLAEELYPGQRYFTEKEAAHLQEEGVARTVAEQEAAKNKQQGHADPKLLAAIAAAGGLAAYFSQNPQDPEVLAAAGMIGLTRGKLVDQIKSGFRVADKALGRGTTRLANIDPTLRRGLRDQELGASKAAAAASDKIHEFIVAAKDLPKEEYAALDKAYMENDSTKIAEALRGKPALQAGYKKVREFLDDTRDMLQDLGRFKKGLTEYLPRVVKDYKGLIESLGQVERTHLEKLMLEANAKTVALRGREMTEVERSVLLNNYLKADPASSHLPGFAKDRTVKMTDELRPFYHSLEDSLIRYAHASTEDIATARFFGQDLRTTSEGGKKYTNLDNSVGALTDRAMREGRMTPQQAVEVQQILRARFGPGEKAPDGWIQDARNATSIATLGQLGSGLIQSSEALFSAYHHGIRPAIEAAGILALGRGILPKEFGLANHIIEETIGKRLSGQATSLVLKANLLAALDRLGMKQNLTASYIKNKLLSQTESGRAQLTAKWGADYGADMPALIKELQESTRSQRGELVDSLLYQELSDVRPTSRAELPQQFNQHPNLRFMWQLKQFMLTQGDILRRDAYNKIKTGDPKEVAIGLKNLTLFTGMLAIATVPADLLKNWIMGRDVDLDKIDYLENITRNFGLGRYDMNRIGGDTPAKSAVQVAGSMVTPPVASVIANVAEGIDKPKKLVPMIPLGGRIYYNRELGGNEAFKRSQAVQKRIEARDAAEKTSPALKAKRLQRKALREAKQLQKLRSTQ